MSEKQAFIQSIYEEAIAAGLTDAAARVMASQAGIESAYGTNAPGFNYFGVTKGASWNGATIPRADTDANGKAITQEFRSYPTRAAGIADRIAVMNESFPGFNNASSIDAALAALRNGTKGEGLYYTAPQEKYEATVKGIEGKYLPASTVTTIPASRKEAQKSKGGDGPSAADFLTSRQYGKPGGGVGVNADRLDPEFSNRMTALISAAEAATGDKVFVFEGYRDPKRSAQLRANYKQVDVTWDGVTYSPQAGVQGYKASAPGKSQHNYGMATDIRAGKEPDKYPSGPAFEYMVKHASEFGIHWYGSTDPAHFEIPENEFNIAIAGGSLRKFKNYNPDGLVPPGDISAVASELDVKERVSPLPAPSFYRGGAEPVPRQSGRFENVRDTAPTDRPRDQAIDLEVIRASAAYGVRRQPGAAPAKIPKPEEFVSFDDVFTAEQFMPDGGRDYSKLSGANRGIDPIGPGPSSWFTSSRDVAPYFGAKETAHGGQVISIASVAPTPLPGRPAALDASVIAPQPMPGRPGALSEPAADPAPAKQTIRVGKHDYEVGATFDQGGFHYTVTPDGIQKSRIPTGEKTVVGGIIGQVVKEKLKEAVPEVTAQVGVTAAATLEAAKQKGAALVDQAQKIGSSLSGLGGAFSGIFGGGGPPQPAADRVATIIHQGYAGGVANLSPIDLGVDFERRVTITPYPPVQIQVVAPKAVGGVKEIAFANLNVPGAPRPTETRDPVTERKVVPVKSSTSTVVPLNTPITRIGSDSKIESVGAQSAPVKTQPVAKPTYTTVTTANPAYDAWVRQQARSTGVDVKEGHGGAAPTRSSQMDAAGPPPPKTITKTVTTPAPTQKTTTSAPAAKENRTASQSTITTTTTTRAAEVSQATIAAANNNAGWVSGGGSSSGSSSNGGTVEIASGKTVAVGAMGTAQDGRYVYQVQEDGSVKNLTTGRTTAPATSRK